MTATESFVVDESGDLWVIPAGGGPLMLAGGIGVPVTGIPRAGQVPTAAGPSGAAWATPGVALGSWPLDSFTGTDDAKMTSALSALFTAGGGTIVLSPRAHTFANQWTTTYSAGVATAVRIQGAGVAFNGAWGTPTAATSCTFTYSGPGAAMMDFQHIGTIEITGCRFTQANTGKPFMLTTNATPNIHDNVFSGGGSGLTCATDGILLGGTGTTPGAGDTAPYQGYQGSVRRNFFDGIRCGVSGQVFANGAVIEANVFSLTCGSTSTTGGAITLNGGGSGNSVFGVSVRENLFETAYYKYAIWCDFTAFCYFAGNSFYDPSSANTLAYIRFSSVNCTGNTVIGGFATLNSITFPSLVFVSQAITQNTVIYPTLTVFDGVAAYEEGIATDGEENGVPHITFGNLISGNKPTVQTGTANPNTGGKTGTQGSVYIYRNTTVPSGGLFLRGGAFGTPQWFIPGTMFPLVSQTAGYTVLQDDYMVLMNGSSLTATLPSPANLIGKKWEITNQNSSALTVAAPSGGSVINGAASVSVAQYQTAAVRTDGTNFYASVS